MSTLGTVLCAVAALSPVFANASVSDGSPAEAPPRLVVLVVVDQCRPDYLERFAPHFAGFFARLRREGRWFVDGEQHHGRTVTSAGHATLGTGRFPAHHGIVGNEFYDPDTDRNVGSTNDRDARPVGDLGGGYSAHYLLTDGLGDWWQTQYPEAKVLGVSIKPRSAILPLGRQPHACYWFDDRRRAFVSSASCMTELPAWVAERAKEDPYTNFPAVWETTLGDAAEFEKLGCSIDDAPGENSSGAPATKTFPHALGTDRPERRSGSILSSPWTDDLVLDFARDAVEHEGLGADEVPDFLLLGLSGTDLIGHRHGPESWEIAEQIVHLDHALASFTEFLEEHVHGRVVYALSSDHGVQSIPEVAVSLGRPGACIDARTVSAAVAEVMAEVAPEMAEAVVLLPEGGIRFRRDLAEQLHFDVDELATEVAAKLRERPEFTDARSAAELREPLAADDWMGELLRCASDGARMGDILLVHPEGTIYTAGAPADRRPLATTHGTPWPADVQVPIVFLGPGIVPGHVKGRAWTVDVAPTLAELAAVPCPTDLDGVVLDLTGAGTR